MKLFVHARPRSGAIICDSSQFLMPTGITAVLFRFACKPDILVKELIVLTRYLRNLSSGFIMTVESSAKLFALYSIDLCGTRDLHWCRARSIPLRFFEWIILSSSGSTTILKIVGDRQSPWGTD